MKKALAIALMAAFSAALAFASENTTTAGNTNTQKHPMTKKTFHKTVNKNHKGGKKGKKSSGGTTTPAPK